MKKIKLSRLFIILCLLILPLAIMAQGPPDPQDTPIDGGLSLLLAAGAAYGVKKYRDHKKKHEEQHDPE